MSLEVKYVTIVFNCQDAAGSLRGMIVAAAAAVKLKLMCYHEAIETANFATSLIENNTLEF